jgi:hypothetical protein
MVQSFAGKNIKLQFAGVDTMAQRLRNRNPKIVEIVDSDPEHLMFSCKKCGQRWQPMYAARGKFYRGTWQCPKGCKPDA